MTLDQLFGSPWGALLIFALRVVDVTLDTLRVLFAIRGKREIAGALGFFMALIFIFAVGNAVKHLDSIWHILGYAAGYACGTMVGITIERRLAYGLATVRVVSKVAGVEIAEALRELGFGVTETPGFGRSGSVEILHSTVQRKALDTVLATIDKWDSGAFVTVEEPKVLRGGNIARRDVALGIPFSRWTRHRA